MFQHAYEAQKMIEIHLSFGKPDVMSNAWHDIGCLAVVIYKII
jgi:hypothetical protein